MATDKVCRELTQGVLAAPGGITVSGGEPMEQWPALKEALHLIKEVTSCGGWRSLRPSIILFTGWTSDALSGSVGFEELAEYIDVVIAGPYIKGKPVSAGLVSSANQEILILTSTHVLEEIVNPPQSLEIHCEGDEVTITGFPSKQVKAELTRELK